MTELSAGHNPAEEKPKDLETRQDLEALLIGVDEGINELLALALDDSAAVVESFVDAPVPVETDGNERLMHVINAFQAKFPDYNNSDFSDPKNLFIFSDPDRSRKVSFIKAYASSRGFNAHIGKTNTAENEDGSLALVLNEKRPTWVNVPIVQSSMDDFNQTWMFGQEQEAAGVAEIVRKGITVDENFLTQVVSIKEDQSGTMVPLTFRDLLNDQLRLSMINNGRIKELIGPVVGDRGARVILVRRPISLSEKELQAVTLARLTDQSQRDEVAALTPVGRGIMRHQVVQIETQLALLMMDRFSTPTNSS